MTAKEYLQQVKVKDARIRNLQRDMAALRGLMFSLGNSSVEGERVQTSPDPDKFGTLYSKIDGKERQIVESIDDLVDFKLRVTEEIGQLKERDEGKAPSVKINDEAVKVGAITFGKGTKAYRCPNCKRLVIYRDRFCRDCGQKFRWED